jgi:hypothetical protein
MACQICGEKSGFFPICKNCNTRKEKGEISKCQDCGIWKEGDKPLCYDCFLKSKKLTKKEAEDYVKTDNEKEEDDFRHKFPATYLTEDGHWVRSKAEQIIDNWLYHKGITHGYERRVPIEEEVYCDFFINIGSKVWIEYWGLDEKEYLKRKKIKKDFYAKYKKNLIELDDKDIEKIDDIMPIKLRPFLPATFSFD